MWETTGVGASEHEWETWLERLYSLRRDKRGSHERPHKPVLLLSIIDLLDRGVLKTNSVPFSDELVETFKRYFAVVKEEDDKPTIENPFFFLSGDKFWQVIPQGANEPMYREGYASGAPGVGQLRKQGVTGRFDEGLWALMSDAVARHQLREALIARYFPERREQLAALVVQQHGVKTADAVREELPPLPARDAAFRRIILEIYDYTCAACGLRLKLTSDLSLVEAAHLIPFSVGYNDKPNNGLALCPNHHWAMDRYLIAPCPDSKHPEGVWKVSPRLEDRRTGERKLLELAGRPVLRPDEEKFYPAIESLRWREQHLVTKY